MFKEKFKSKYFEGSPIFRQLIETRNSHFEPGSIARKITTVLYMFYLWPVKKLFDKNAPMMIDFDNERKFYFNELQNLLHVYNHDGFNLIRVGAKNDGGYIMLDDLSCNVGSMHG